MEHAERAVIDQYWPWRKTRADLLHVLAITGVEVSVLELLNLLQRLKFLQALLQRHHAGLLHASAPSGRSVPGPRAPAHPIAVAVTLADAARHPQCHSARPAQR